MHVLGTLKWNFKNLKTEVGAHVQLTSFKFLNWLWVVLVLLQTNITNVCSSSCFLNMCYITNICMDVCFSVDHMVWKVGKSECNILHIVPPALRRQKECHNTIPHFFNLRKCWWNFAKHVVSVKMDTISCFRFPTTSRCCKSV